MAVKSSAASGWHLLFRLVGLTGFMALAVALALWYSLPESPLPMQVALGGAIAVGLALLFELKGVSGVFSSRRAALGSNVLVQALLAAVLLGGVNVFAFHFYKRFDWTADQSFTLPTDVKADLAKLRGETDIVVLQQYASFGQRGDVKQDKFDLAAQKKIVEKVKDLAELFQDLGPRFRVQVLDIQDDDYQEKLKKIKKEAAPLGEAIEQAPENSIFFWSAGPKKLQRLSFNDVYQLDKIASQQGEGNLVLNDQGVHGFARKVFNIEEKKPRIGVAVVHELLSVKTADPFYGMPGLKKSLEARGYDYRDVILKAKWGQGPRPEPAVLTHDENRFERLDAQSRSFERITKVLQEEKEEFAGLLKEWRNWSLEELNKKYAVVRTARGTDAMTHEVIDRIRKQQGPIPSRRVTEVDRTDEIAWWDERIKESDEGLQSLDKKLARIREDKGSLNIENLEEQRRITDLRAKFNRMVADVDLLVLPRHTIYDLVREEAIPNSVHTLDDAQLDALKDFMKAGKPVLFCLGPSNERSESFDAPRDNLNDLLTSLGLQLPNQTVLFNVEADAMADRGERTVLGGSAEVPPVKFAWPKGSVMKNVGKTDTAAPNPVRTSLDLTARAFGKNQPTEMALRSPRPVYFLTDAGLRRDAVAAALGVLGGPWGPLEAAGVLASQNNKKVDESAFIMVSSDESWNDDQPFPTDKRVPHYERPKPDDPNRGTVQERRRGPFPIGVAVETSIPSSWYDDGKAPDKLPKVRVAVIGHGGLFMGENLKPMNEKLFLDTANWLMGRDDLLARDNRTWSYPRVQLSESANSLWQWGTRLGLPLLFVYLGMVMLLVRRMR